MKNIIEDIVRKLKLADEWIKAILLKGSMQSIEVTDFWSDTDLLVVLKESENIQREIFLNLLSNLGEIIAKENYFSEDSTTLRVAIQINNEVEFIDLSICTYERWLLSECKCLDSSKLIFWEIDWYIKLNDKIVNYSFEFDIDNIEKNWFKYFMCIKKIARDDILIGLDLLMDLLKEYLILLMIERDIKYNTNIHRYWYNEILPEKLNLSLLNYKDKLNILFYIRDLANEYDQKLVVVFKEYTSRFNVIDTYIKESINNLK